MIFKLLFAHDDNLLAIMSTDTVFLVDHEGSAVSIY